MDKEKSLRNFSFWILDGEGGAIPYTHHTSKMATTRTLVNVSHFCVSSAVALAKPYPGRSTIHHFWAEDEGTRVCMAAERFHNAFVR